MQELDDGDTERIRDEATATDADNHDGAAEKDGLANADATHEDWHETHHEEFEEDFDGVEHAVSLLACLRRREEAREELREHLLVKDRVERPAHDDEDDHLPDLDELEHADDLAERRRLAFLEALRLDLVLCRERSIVLRRHRDQDDELHCRHSGARPENQVRVHREEEACAERCHGIAERAPGSGLAVLKGVAAAQALRDRLEDRASREERHREVDRTDDSADVEVRGEHRHVDPGEERADEDLADGEELQHRLLHAELILQGAVDEHQDERDRAAEGIDRADLRAREPLLRRQPDLEERPPDAPAREEQQDLKRTRPVERIRECLQ